MQPDAAYEAGECVFGSTETGVCQGGGTVRACCLIRRQCDGDVARARAARMDDRLLAGDNGDGLGAESGQRLSTALLVVTCSPPSD